MRRPTAWEHHGQVFETIVLATDGEPGAAEALCTAIALARRYRSRMVVLYVSRSAAAPRSVRDQVDQLREAQIPTRLAVVSAAGEEASAITDVAAALHADVVITGTGNSATAGDPSFVGRVAQRVLALSRCPVLAVPAGVGR
jgi:nucleotide-binding universal stress UspA family protein